MVCELYLSKAVLKKKPSCVGLKATLIKIRRESGETRHLTDGERTKSNSEGNVTITQTGRRIEIILFYSMF